MPAPTQRPLWEVGVAALGAYSPDYPAAGTQRWRGAMAPIVVYRGTRLRVDDEGVRGRLVNTGRFELDLSGAAGFNARNNPARDGMPPLDYTFELGPQARYRFVLEDGQQVSAHLKVRAVVSTNGKRSHGRGVVVEPELRWQRRGWPDAASQVQISTQATWASEALHDYYYQVDPAYATPTRPAFDARAGYFGSSLRGSITRRLNTTTAVSVSGNLSHHGGAANADSPLFQRKTTGSVLLAVIWTPWRSEATAQP
jgi:outer membrane scaffolding protein for murein synthesis (MipA/OmpV family)